MEEAWIWYGPDDPVSLSDIRQTGASAVSTALYELPAGEVWPLQLVLERKSLIEAAGLTWLVCESIAVHEVLKIGHPADQYSQYLANYKTSLENLGKAGVPVLSYSFMPLFDWLRTDLNAPWHDGSTALGFSMDKFRVFDLCILKRPNSEKSYTESQISKANVLFSKMSEVEVTMLSATIMSGLHGQTPYSTTDRLQSELERWSGITKEQLAQNLQRFVRELLPVAKQWNIKLSLHPDDPPRSVFGLPNVASTLADYDTLFQAVPDPLSGITFCMGSLASRTDNDVLRMVRYFRSRVHFVHLRNVVKMEDGGLVEAGHIEGDADLVGVMTELVKEKQRRENEEYEKVVLPMRADHGHRMTLSSSVETRKCIPGHAMFGRARGLAEIRGVQAAILAFFDL